MLTKDADGKESAEAEKFNSHIRKDIEKKYAKKREYLESSLRRAQYEETVHLKQEKLNRYERLYDNYAFPQDYLINEGPGSGRAQRITA